MSKSCPDQPNPAPVSNQSLNLTPALYDYMLANSLREPDVLRHLRNTTQKLEMGIMQISPEQGQFFAMLVRLLNMKQIIEVGVFTGYSSLAMALALPEDGRLVACDVSKEWTDIARGFWRQAMVEERIELRLGPAQDSLNALLAEQGAGCYDFAFIDADKTSYQGYYEACLQLVRPGGLIAIDNVLWGGSVIDEQDQSADTQAIRKLNALLHNDPRVDISLLPIGDGLTLLRRR